MTRRTPRRVAHYLAMLVGLYLYRPKHPIGWCGEEGCEKCDSEK